MLRAGALLMMFYCRVINRSISSLREACVKPAVFCLLLSATFCQRNVIRKTVVTAHTAQELAL
jgi:hypothetical protein